MIHTERKDQLGRISYIGDDGLVWVMWQPWRSRKDYGASGERPEHLKVIPATPKPWFKKRHYLMVDDYGYDGLDVQSISTRDLRESMRSEHRPFGVLERHVYELAKEEPVWPMSSSG